MFCESDSWYDRRYSSVSLTPLIVWCLRLEEQAFAGCLACSAVNFHVSLVSLLRLLEFGD